MAIIADKDKIREWLNEGIKKEATHCLIICDTWDLWDQDSGFEDFPRYIMQGEDIREIASKYTPGGIEVLKEIYNLKMDIKKQLEEEISMNY